ncbi:MAG: hypothetical protein M5T61_21270, partial [Acidimicrobiia bacterium]|nr:hypothetical protein [Acidimicrobiia bacterium]
KIASVGPPDQDGRCTFETFWYGEHQFRRYLCPPLRFESVRGNLRQIYLCNKDYREGGCPLQLFSLTPTGDRDVVPMTPADQGTTEPGPESPGPGSQGRRRVNRAMFRAAIGLVALLIRAAPAAAQSFKTRLSFSFADDNLLRDAGETRISSPTAYFRAVAGDADRPHGQRLGLLVVEAAPVRLRRRRRGLALLPARGRGGAGARPGRRVVPRRRHAYLRATYFFEPDRKRGLQPDDVPHRLGRMRLGFHLILSWGLRHVPEALPQGPCRAPSSSWTCSAGTRSSR